MYRPVGAREIQIDRRAVADLTVDRDVAAGLLDEAVDHRQAKTGAPYPFPWL